MAVLSLDIGTTKICALVMDEDEEAVIETRLADNAFLSPLHHWDRQQDPERIFQIVEGLVSELARKYGAFRCIGVTCQMHGILYVNAAGRAASPLYTWQDQCASLPYASGETYAEYLAKFSPSPVAPGYGLATCFYHLKNSAVPTGAAKLCTIGDYIVMRLCGFSLPMMHATNAAGMGFFDLRASRFDESAAEKAGLEASLLPRVSNDREIPGETAAGIPVSVSIGDNQASFLGTVRDFKGSVSVNIGTGSQISLLSSDPESQGALEARPFFDGLFLLVGASLCGGRAYAMLEAFFQQVLAMAMAGLPEAYPHDRPLYPLMNALASAKLAEANGEALVVNTQFAGSREDPSIRGSILNISEDNFTPAQFVRGFLNGISDELYRLYLPVREKGSHKTLIGSGNGIRKNEPLRRILQEKFNMPLELAPHEEEAAYGAALYALACV